MTENMAADPGRPLFFARTGQAQSTDASLGPGGSSRPFALDGHSLRVMTEGELQEVIVSLLARLERRTFEEVATRQAHTDGTVAIDSMTAVWVIATVGKALGRRPLMRLSDVDSESLRSVGGVARLIRCAIDTTSVAGAA